MPPATVPITRTVALTLLALLAFAANSVLCRLALGENMIDPSSFTTVRLASGILVLLILVSVRRSRRTVASHGSWTAGFLLYLYAITFSFAYLTLDTGTGALILFGTVQITMILHSMLTGKRLSVTEWTGVGIAFTGFVYLMLPGVTAPSIQGFMLMSIAGIGWGLYTLSGKRSLDPLGDTARNFLRTFPMLIITSVAFFHQVQLTATGIFYAVLSGALASAIGYAIWYSALGGLSALQASVVQLLVPVLAALGGVLFMAEPVTLRLSLSTVLILGGILIVILGRNAPNPANR